MPNDLRRPVLTLEWVKSASAPQPTAPKPPAPNRPATATPANGARINGSVTLHAYAGKVWASPPARPWLKDGAVIDETTGKPRYLSVVDFANHATRRAWSEQIVRATRSAHPDALPFWEPQR